MLKINGGRAAAARFLAPLAPHGHKHATHVPTPSPSTSPSEQPLNVSGLVAGLWHLAVGLIVLLLVVVVVALIARVIYRRGIATTVQRPRLSVRLKVKLRLHPGPGFAGRIELWLKHSIHAARRDAKRTRPRLTPKERHGPRRNYATFHGRAQGWLFPQKVYSPFSSAVLKIAPPQIGKSSDASREIIDAPGPVVVTSIRGDLISNTAGLRQRVGRLHVWNPEQVGHFGSTFAWNLVAGCEDINTAVRRAGYQVEAVNSRGLSEQQFWSDQAAMVLAAHLHAAALVGQNILTVYRWISTRDVDQPLQVLKRHPGADEVALLQITRFADMAARTRDGVITTLGQIFQYMIDPNVVQMLTPVGEGFDFQDFLLSHDSLYLVSGGRGSPVAPLFTAFLGELAFCARGLGERLPSPAPRQEMYGSVRLARWYNRRFYRGGGTRLDPPVTIVGDEITNVAPVPVTEWVSWAAGSGIRLHIYAQTWAQIVDRWGREAAESLWGSVRCKVIFPQTSEKGLYEQVQSLLDKVHVRGEPYTDHLGHRRYSHDTIDVLSNKDLRQLPPGRALVIQGDAKPTIVRTEFVGDRADVKAWKRSGVPIRLPAPVRRAIPKPDPALLPSYNARPEVAPPPQDELEIRRAARRTASAATETTLEDPAHSPQELPNRGEVWHPRPPAPRSRADEDWRPWHRGTGTGDGR